MGRAAADFETAKSGADIRVADARKPWMRPEVTELDMADTAAHPGPGVDGGVIKPDCTLS